MVTIKPEPPSPAAEPTTSSKKRTRASSRASAGAAEAIVKSEVKAEGVAIKAEAVLKGEEEGGDGAGLLIKLKASWATLDTTSTASEESPCT